MQPAPRRLAIPSSRLRRRLAPLAIAAVLLAGLLALAPAAGAGMVADVRDRGELRCGITSMGQGLGTAGASGEWQGFFPDLCRGLAAAVLGDGRAVHFFDISTGPIYDAIRSGDVDLNVSNTTGVEHNDVGQGIRFVAPVLYDGQGFLRRRSAPPPTPQHPSRVCISGASPGQVIALRRHIEASHLPWTVAEFGTSNGRSQAFLLGQCELMSTDRLILKVFQQKQPDGGAEFELLPDLIGREPVGPFVRNDDPQWFELVRWALNSLVLAELKGITQATVGRQEASTDPEVRRLLGLDPGAGAGLDLDDRWAFRMIRETGSYGELFERTLGRDSPLKLERGLNRLWTDGGVLYPLPFR